MFFPTGHFVLGFHGNETKSPFPTHSTALYTSKNVILFNGFATVVPPVPRATFIKPAPFNCPKIFLIITVVLQTCVKTQYKKQIFRN